MSWFLISASHRTFLSPVLALTLYQTPSRWTESFLGYSTPRLAHHFNQGLPLESRSWGHFRYLSGSDFFFFVISGRFFASACLCIYLVSTWYTLFLSLLPEGLLSCQVLNEVCNLVITPEWVYIIFFLRHLSEPQNDNKQVMLSFVLNTKYIIQTILSKYDGLKHSSHAPSVF